MHCDCGGLPDESPRQGVLSRRRPTCFRGKVFLLYSVTVSEFDSNPATSSRQLILESARAQLQANGILGLRVADVAEGAHCSITQIYRFFGDRDGLLAQVLGDMFDELLTQGFNRYIGILKSKEQLTIDDLVDNLPSHEFTDIMNVQEIRVQILATSVNNPQLRQRLEAISQSVYRQWIDAIEELDTRVAPGVEIDWRVFTIMLMVQSMYYRTLLGDEGFTNEDYKQFLRDKLNP